VSSDLDGRCFVRRGRAFVPADLAADELLASVEDGAEVIFTIRRPRSPQHHRWFFSMLRKVVDNTELWPDEEELLLDLKDAVGMSKRRRNPLTGRTVERSGSISFAAMGEARFTRFRARCCYVLSLVLGCTPEELMAEVDATQGAAA
jgi:hypothetical protein